MDCLNRKQLEQFLKGKLEPEQLLAVDEHVSDCVKCRATLRGLPSAQRTGLDMGAMLLGVEDCPDYEELSAYIDKALGIEQAKAVELHANTCELCTRDIARIQEMRSHAAMRPKVTLRQGMSKRTARNPLITWKRALAGITAAAAVAAVAFTLSRPVAHNVQMAQDPGQPTTDIKINGDKQPAVTSDQGPKTDSGSAAPGTVPGTISVPQPGVEKPKPTPPAPTYVAILKDGSYRVIRHNGGIGFAKDGAVVKDELEARLEAAIQAKLRNGKMRPAKSVQMAYAKFGDLRGGDYAPPPTAPKQLTPDRKIILDATPTFKWSEVDLAVSYRVQVFREGKLVAEETTDNNGLTLDTPLQRGQAYMWRVSARFSQDGSWSTSGAAAFKILSDDDSAAIEKIKDQLPGSHMALGAAYEYYGLNDEARAEYRLLRQSNPHSNLVERLSREAGQ